MVLIGPFLWLYLKSVARKWTALPKKEFLHFVLPVLFMAFFSVMNRSMTAYFYQAAVLHMSVYVVASVLLLFGNLHETVAERLTHQWMRLLTTAVGIILCTYYVQLIVDSSQTYILITACAALTLYLLSFWGMTRMKVFSKNSMQKTAADEVQFAPIAERIRLLFEQEKIHTDPQLTVNRLAERMEVPPYLISKTVNVVFGKSFPELLHEHRIAEATHQLLHPDYSHLSIEGIATGSGFQSVSAFYNAFKKVNGMTPTEWKRRHVS